MNGIELAIQIKSKHPKCKVLLFSGQTVTADLLETANKQGHDFVLLAKPIHPTDLLAAIKRL
jgi:DNA-binding NtrC family response regulator